MLNRIHLLSCLVISAILKVWLPELTQISPGRSCEADRHCQTGGPVIHSAVGRYVGTRHRQSCALVMYSLAVNCMGCLFLVLPKPVFCGYQSG